MKRAAETAGDGRMYRPMTPATRLSATFAVASLAFLTALPISAAVDPINDDQIAATNATEQDQPSEDRDTISSVRPKPDPVGEIAPAPRKQAIPSLAFPLASPGSYTDSFGEPRDGGSRSHQGIDIFADKLTPVVAAADGTVTLVRDTIGGDCCVVRLRHADGSETLYLHLNNDTPGTDDGLGYGIADGIAVGAAVEAGQVIGFVGDSGNAEETPPHLHFEYHDASGSAVDPYAMLRVAQGADPAEYAAMQEIPTELAFTGVSTLSLAALGFALVLLGTVLIILDRCDDLWEN